MTISSLNLRKKHKQKYKSITYVEGDFTDKIVKELQKKYKMTKVNILRNAILYYKLFLDQNIK